VSDSVAPRPIAALLQLFALSGFALAAPVFDLLRRNPELLIAHGAGAAQIAALACWLLLPVPVAAWGIVQLARSAGERVGAFAQQGMLGLLAAAALLPPLVQALPESGVAVIGPIAAGLGVAAALAYARFAAVRRFVTLLALAPVVFVALFYFDESIAKVRRPTPARAAAPAEPAGSVPVVWLILDELPLVSLLDARREIDAAVFPNFAALAATSTWFRDTTAVGEETAMAVPALLTGVYPDAAKLPIAADHPGNLFTLLGPAYTAQVHETRTLLLPAAQPENASGAAEALHRDLLVLFGHLIAPADLRTRLPPVTEDWKSFAEPPDAELARIGGKANYGDRANEFVRFIEGAQSCAEPCLVFAHVVLPHVPWFYTPSGAFYLPPSVFGIERSVGRWGEDDWWVLQGYQRHLLQLGLVDRLLGEWVARLKTLDLWERALVVVTADHGASFWPGQSRRLLEGHRHPADILRVPLFVKTPGQRAGAIRDVPIETVDILPTVADLLGLKPWWKHDGISVADPDARGRTQRVGFDMAGERHEFDVAEIERGLEASLDRKLAAFGSGSRGAWYRFGAFGGLVGTAVEAGPPAGADGLIARIASEPFDVPYQPPPPAPRRLPLRLTGRLELAQPLHDPAQVAVAIRGKVRAVGPTYRLSENQRGFSLLLPDGARSAGVDQLGIHLVTGPPEAPVLTPARVEVAPILNEVARILMQDPAQLRR
jgi:hypothetical protein